MRRPYALISRIAQSAAVLALVASCAGAPKSAPEPAVTTTTTSTTTTTTTVYVPVAKERTVIVKTAMILKETVYYPDGLVDAYTVYTYDAAKQNLLSKATFDPARADPVEKVVSEFGSTGRLVAEVTYGSDGAIKSRRELTWNEGKDRPDLLVSERGLDPKGQSTYSSTYEYDKNFRRITWKAFDAKGALKATTAYTYNAKGFVSLIEIRNGANMLTGTIKVEYSADGSTEKHSYLASDGALQKYEVFALKDGKVLRFEIRRPDNSLAEATDYNLGPLGERLSATTVDGTGKIKEKRSSEFVVREDKKIEVYYE